MAAFLFLYYWEDHREEAAGSEDGLSLWSSTVEAWDEN